MADILAQYKRYHFRRADAVVTATRKAASELAGAPYRIPPRIAGAIWTGTYAFSIRVARLVTVAALVSGLSDGLLRAQVDWASFEVPPVIQDAWKVLVPPSLMGRPEAWLYLAAIAWCFFLGVAYGARMKMVERLRGSTGGQGRRRMAARLNRVPLFCGALIVSCARLKRAAPHQTVGMLRGVDTAVNRLVKELERLERRSRPYPGIPTQRSRAIRDHVGLVSAALRQASVGIDVDPVAGAIKLGDMALRICHAYVRREWGHLLDDVELTGLQPARRWEFLRFAVAGLITAGAAVGAALLGVPDGALTVVIGLVGALTFTKILGLTPGTLALLDSIRGIQRP